MKTDTVCYHLHMESKKNKQMNIITETDSQREQTTDYHWGVGGKRGKIEVGNYEV